jgi:hypothetical protein
MPNNKLTFKPATKKQIAKRCKITSHISRKESEMMEINKSYNTPDGVCVDKVYHLPVKVYKTIEASENAELEQLLCKNKAEVGSTAFKIPYLTKTEESKYAKDYSRRDIVKFTNIEPRGRCHIVLINENKVIIQYDKLVVLLCLALAVKQKRNRGWVNYKENVDCEGIVNNRAQFYRLIGALKEKIKPFIEKDNNSEIIENRGSGDYRLSIMPSRIEPGMKLLRLEYEAVKEEVIKERKKRTQQTKT